MKNLVLSMIALAGLTAACGSSYQAPTERLASSEAAIRSAKELGAQNDPQAALHVKLADEQVATAKNLMHDGENRRADLVLQRADADAELAVMITRERAAKTAADQAKENLTSKAQNGPSTMPMAPSSTGSQMNNGQMNSGSMNNGQ